MYHHHLAIAGQVHVAFQVGHAEFEGILKRQQAILRPQQSTTSMRRDVRLSSVFAGSSQDGAQYH
jgi:hypothetical protein